MMEEVLFMFGPNVRWTCLLRTLLGLALSLTVGAKQPPHIVLIVADDLGWNDIGYHGSEIQTPNLDALAESGVKLENYYVQPLCSPTRGQLMTGRYQIHTGLQSNNLPATCPCGLPLHLPTMADKLREAGYATHMVGKWHLGYFNQNYVPTRRGFESHYGSYIAFEDYYTHMRDGALDFHRNDNPEWNTDYSTHVYRDAAIGLIKEHAANRKHEPLFLYLAFQAVHAPLEVPETYLKIHRSIEDDRRRIYAGMATAMDEAVLSIRKSLEKHGLWDNTIIIFSSDNGGYPTYAGNNWPLRGHKETLWEGGIRVPAFISGPRAPRTRGTSHQLMHVTDWFPTLVNLAGGDFSELDLDGYDMWDTFQGAQNPRSEILHNINHLHPLKGHTLSKSPFNVQQRAALRVEGWKLITGDPGPDEWTPPPHLPMLNATMTCDGEDESKNLWLFNIAEDPEETHDLSADHPDIVKMMLEKLALYNATAVAPIAQSFDPAGRPLPGGVWQHWVD